MIAIIGVLVALLLPAVQAAREAARRNQCQSQLKQIALATLNHESTYKRFPAGGWGFYWVGDPDRGSGEAQPGGWLFSIAPFIEEASIHAASKGLGNDILTPTSPKLKAIAQQMSQPVGVFICPSRREARAYPSIDGTTGKANQPPYNVGEANAPLLYAKTDYCGNGGHRKIGVARGPTQVCYSVYPNCDWQADINSVNFKDSQDGFSGVIGFRTGVRIGQITDGTSKTLLAAEKALPPSRYTTGDHSGDDNCAFTGYDYDTVRFPAESRPPVQDAEHPTDPNNDSHLFESFGGPHSVVITANCDGSVHAVTLDIDLSVWNGMGSRSKEDDLGN